MFTCAGATRGSGECGISIDDASSTVRQTPRYFVAAALLRLLFMPVSTATLSSISTARSPPDESLDLPFDVAVHVRRGDRIWVERSVEKIEIWSEGAIASEVAKMVDTPSGRVLLASDDNAYAMRLAATLGSAGFRVVTIRNDAEAFVAGTNRSVEAAKVCGEECVPPLLATMGAFARAPRLLLSSKSNFGGYLISWWGAINKGKIPTITDLDRVLKPGMLPVRYFCELPWGSRHGFCSGGQTACDLLQFRDRNFCSAAARKRQAGGKDAGVPMVPARWEVTVSAAKGKGSGKGKGGG
eukprot:2338369-Prymnesium_polylepis.1